MLLVLLTGGLIALVAAPASAQINPFRRYSGPVLSKDDIQAGKEAAARLLAQKPATVGASQFWVGARSGNTGTLSIERIFRQQDRDCRAVRSKIQFKAGGERSFVLNACEVSGQWKVVS
jgi:surface antigen